MAQLRRNERVTVNYLDPAKTYLVKSLDGKVVTSLTGAELKATGFQVHLNDSYSGELFEIAGK